MEYSMIRHLAIYSLLCLVLASCASKPIVDTYNIDTAQYEKDLAQCEEIAEQVASGEITAKSAAFGAGAHPGGGVMGAPGANAAREVLRDLRKPNTVPEGWLDD